MRKKLKVKNVIFKSDFKKFLNKLSKIRILKYLHLAMQYCFKNFDL